MDGLKSNLRSIVDALLSGEIAGEAELEAAKKSAASTLGLSSLPSNADILRFALPEERERLKILVRKPTRTLSGVAVIAAMTSPARCPHGICIPCPGGICNSTPQSYTGREPAAMRAAQHNFDPYDQVMARLGQLNEIGHPLDKAELIIMGGTITSRPIGYQQWFVKCCLMAMNDYPNYPTQPKEWQSFSGVAKENEHAIVRNIGTTFETRPDWCKPDQIARMLCLGATKVELGVQSIRDDLLKTMKRGHSVEDTVRANESLRNAGLKVGFHMMPGLPGSSPEIDLDVFKELFQDPRFRPDYLKIYPTLVVKGTRLYEMYLRSEYKPLEDEDAVELVSRVKALLPRYVRLQRVQRDIPAHMIVAGVKKSNLRQLAGQRLREHGQRCKCIRCREAGLRGISEKDIENIELMQESYEVCGAKEYFLSFEGDDESLVGFLRLRLGTVARIRELHIYGPLVPIGTRKEGWQHKGYGSRLVQMAEKIASENGYKSIEITSGIGAREYYRRMGYDLREPYMIKHLS